MYGRGWCVFRLCDWVEAFRIAVDGQRISSDLERNRAGFLVHQLKWVLTRSHVNRPEWLQKKRFLPVDSIAINGTLFLEMGEVRQISWNIKPVDKSPASGQIQVISLHAKKGNWADDRTAGCGSCWFQPNPHPYDRPLCYYLNKGPEVTCGLSPLALHCRICARLSPKLASFSRKWPPLPEKPKYMFSFRNTCADLRCNGGRRSCLLEFNARSWTNNSSFYFYFRTILNMLENCSSYANLWFATRSMIKSMRSSLDRSTFPNPAHLSIPVHSII